MRLSHGRATNDSFLGALRCSSILLRVVWDEPGIEALAITLAFTPLGWRRIWHSISTAQHARSRIELRAIK